MCTAISYKDKFFGRNLDLEFELPFSKLIIVPKKYFIQYKASNQVLEIKYDLIGMGMVVDNYPLYYDAMNEKGLFMAGLNFEGYAKYFSTNPKKKNICPFEFILYILGKCKDVNEVKEALKNINLVDINFSDSIKNTPLHWMVSDKNSSIVIESTKKGIKIYDNVYGVLTNNPEFPYHLENMNNYINLSPNIKRPLFNDQLSIISNGLATTGLPGGLSSIDRFVRATYTKLTSVSSDNEIDNVNQFFHILNSVSQVKGTVIGHEKRYELTIYSNCYSFDTLTCYYKTYTNNRINALCLKDINTNNSNQLLIFDLNQKEDINYLKTNK